MDIFQTWHEHFVNSQEKMKISNHNPDYPPRISYRALSTSQFWGNGRIRFQ